MFLWYARRGVSWVPLLVCLFLVAGVALLLRQWPSSQFVLLPAALAVCAAATGFVFDESATAVVTVTPRGAGWRRTARCLVALLPAAVWISVMVTLDQQEIAVDRSDWVLAGLGCQLVALGAAALASRRGVAARPAGAGASRGGADGRVGPGPPAGTVPGLGDLVLARRGAARGWSRRSCREAAPAVSLVAPAWSTGGWVRTTP